MLNLYVNKEELKLYYQLSKNPTFNFLFAISHIAAKNIAVVKISIYETMVSHLSKIVYIKDTKTEDEINNKTTILISVLETFEIGDIVLFVPFKPKIPTINAHDKIVSIYNHITQ